MTIVYRKYKWFRYSSKENISAFFRGRPIVTYWDDEAKPDVSESLPESNIKEIDNELVSEDKEIKHSKTARHRKRF